jgi:branched-chain amino acid transport system permease protein/neutral amino acid transport system permease protein
MTLLPQAIGFGLVEASILAIAAVGFTMQFGIANLLNLAFTEVMSVAGFAAYAAMSHGLNLWLAMVIGAVVGGLLSVAINRLVYRPFQRRGTKPATLIIVSLALNLVIQNTVLAVVGSSYFTYPVTLGAERYHFLGARFSGDELIIIGLAVVLMAAMHFLLRYTQLGRAMRAIASNRDLGRSSGIPAFRIEAVVWCVSGGLGGIAGVVLFLNTSTFTPATGSSFLVVIIAAAVLGGVGDVYGAIFGAIVIGEAISISALWLPSYSTIAAFVLLFAMLLVRPQGIRAVFRLSGGEAA